MFQELDIKFSLRKEERNIKFGGGKLCGNSSVLQKKNLHVAALKQIEFPLGIFCKKGTLWVLDGAIFVNMQKNQTHISS
jgi:hypothetical protein